MTGKISLAMCRYVQHVYRFPLEAVSLPLADEAFVAAWDGAAGQGVDYLEERFGLAVNKFTFAAGRSIRVNFTQTLAGKLPVITTQDHADFCALVALVQGKTEVTIYPSTINAMAMHLSSGPLTGMRLLLFNAAPYSNIPATVLGLGEKQWLEKSTLLRTRHESAHYETLRLAGGMRNHALDEIIADGLGQIAAFGTYSAKLQKVLFGLNEDGSECSGRLQFYCRGLNAAEQVEIYRMVAQVLPQIEKEITALLARAASEYEILRAFASRSLYERVREIS